MSPPRDIRLTGSAADRAALVIGPLVVVISMMVMAGWTGTANGDDMGHRGIDALLVIAGALPLVLAWIIAAVGMGWPLRLLLADRSEHALAIQVALGVAAMLTVTAALGRLGLLQLGGSAGAWVLVIIGLGLAAAQLRRWWLDSEPSVPAPHWLWWTAAPAVAVLLLASTSAPGWLWDSEFGGYDALSYHLQLPKQWMSLGAITPLEHNVYSFLPGYMEAAYYHLMILRGDAIDAVYACQLLHAAMAVITAVLISRILLNAGRDVASASGVLLLGTPWIIVAGSLAYNEMPVALMLAGGLLVYRTGHVNAAQRGAAMGTLAACACAAKLTAAGMVALPLGVLLLMAVPRRMWLCAVSTGSIAGIIVLGPYLLGNAAVSGNPVFPFATSIFGTGHWNQQQVEIWNAGHIHSGGVLERLGEGWNQLGRYGIGVNPYEVEPWFAQWSILPWLTLAALVAGLLVAWRTNRGESARTLLALAIVMAIQLVFWLSLTHIKSRFMLPLAAPAVATVAIGLSMFIRSANIAGRGRAVLPGALAAMLLAWCSVPAVIYAKQAGGAPAAAIAMADVLTGRPLHPVERRELGRSSHPAILLNHSLPGSRTLMVGEAAPFYVLSDYTYQSTWDRGPLSVIMRDAPDQPQRWMQELRAAGFTHLLVHPDMLRRWERAGWNDPLLTVERVLDAAEGAATLQRQWPDGRRLYSLD